MSLRVEWLASARADLASIPDWHIAAAVDAAVDRYAVDGIGFQLHVPRDDQPDEYRLLLPRMRTYVRVRRSAATLYVERVIFRL